MAFKIALGMSGGIDSSVAAYLLKKEGHEVIGFTLKLWDKGSRCCDIKDISNARQFAHHLGFKHYTLDLRKEFRQAVVDPFIQEYIHGRTPNPCVVCNREIKFAYLFQKLTLLDCDYIATGHYAGIIKEGRLFLLSKARDIKKSQEYFLARVEKELLSRILFPLSDMTKQEIKKIAAGLDFNFQGDESQEVCFIDPEKKYHEFIKEHIDPDLDVTGHIVDKSGKVLGKCDCYFKYTIGQRGGLGISDTTPNYVLKIDHKKRDVIIGKKDDVYIKKFSVTDCYWYKELKKNEFTLNVKIRYNHKEAKALIKKRGVQAEVEFNTPQHAVAPGQLAVFYEQEKVIGSGWIDKTD
ncbi:MAG: tRNA 2-thiouridine(34) synthase MnmA [Spirochaetes bacterium]|nr:tRNA 2-thiouridine(34) synthase MnmA [Spirochaetota bacterium]